MNSSKKLSLVPLNGMKRSPLKVLLLLRLLVDLLDDWLRQELPLD